MYPNRSFIPFHVLCICIVTYVTLNLSNSVSLYIYIYLYCCLHGVITMITIHSPIQHNTMVLHHNINLTKQIKIPSKPTWLEIVKPHQLNKRNGSILRILNPFKEFKVIQFFLYFLALCYIDWSPYQPHFSEMKLYSRIPHGSSIGPLCCDYE